MASMAVVNAVEAYLKAEHPDVAFRGLKDEGDAPPADGGTFVAIQYTVPDAEQASIGAPGSNVFRHTGAIRLVVSVGKKTVNPREAAVTLCDALAVTMRSKSISGVITHAPTSPVFDDRSDDGLYHVFSFSTPYQHDVLG
ncbi:hypothetical protein [Hyphomonas sp.]|uniref:hypothetical protein n=1 Tax=Hyphomonas sp. TaxID=87 RepID=UPI0025BCD68C|nr:hypothetical protein [Hyphomonas sp.]